MKFHLFVAFRYLRARNKKLVLSVATWVSLAGVAAGVAALNVALSLNAGIQNEFLTRILGATSHINVRSLTSVVIGDYGELARSLQNTPEVVSVFPTVSGYSLLQSYLREQPAIIKGVDLKSDSEYSNVRGGVREGGLARFDDPGGPPTIVLGKELASALNVDVGDFVRAFGARGAVAPSGRVARVQDFEVIAIYETGLWDYDYNLALLSIPAAQRYFDYRPNQTSLLELRIRDQQDAEEVAEVIRDRLGPTYEVKTWIEINKPLFSALRLEKLALFIAIGLIVLVAALNITSTLTLAVNEKNHDIAVIAAMGGTSGTIQGIFMLQGLIIGLVGAGLGSALGAAISLYLDHYQLIPLDPQIYQIAHVPFLVSWQDLLLIWGLAMAVSFVATIFPSRSASRLDPVVALRND